MTAPVPGKVAVVALGLILSASPADVGFVDVAPQAGFTAKTTFGGERTKKYIIETTGGGVAFFDYDNDGWPDIFLVNGSRLEGFGSGPQPTNHLYHNNRDGTFRDVTKQAGLEKSGWGQGVCAGDYDNDGYTDLFVTYWGHNVLYHNNGDGTFTDVTAQARLLGVRSRWGSGCAFLDFDRDGHLDLFVANYVDFDTKTAPEPGTNARCQYRGIAVNCGPRGLPGESNLLYHSNGDGTFTDVSERAGISKIRGNYGLGVLTSDFDNDGWPDIYVANDTNASLLFHNNHDGTFQEMGVFAGCAYDADGKENSGMGVAAGDYDQDGWLDILKTNFPDEAPSLYHNTRDGLFTEAARAAGISRNQRWLGWGCGFLDFDNDGWPDIFLVNGHVYPEVDRANLGLSFKQPKVLYRNLGGGRFEDVSGKAGAAITTPSAGRGCAFGDFNNDGRIDILINNMNDAPTLLRNTSRNGNHWIQILASGTKSNRSGIGARIYCVTGSRRQLEEVRSGGSYLSQSDLRVHFGLGEAAMVDLLEIHWPSGIVDKLEKVRADQMIQIKEGLGIVRDSKAGR
ncbi:MAG TPA: CRTAC1 family protein [Terriglobales bacterium]|nr:CRTAC1 family protein [Terriglobales bacterium]